MENTEQVTIVHDYVSDRKTFEEMKATQIEIGKTQRTYKQAYKQCQREGVPFHTFQPPHDGGGTYGKWIPASPAPSANPRTHNVAYALVRGKKYARIESKFIDRDGLKTYPLTRAQIESYLMNYPGVDTSKINWEGMN